MKIFQPLKSILVVVFGILLLHSCELFKDNDDVIWRERAASITKDCNTDYEKAKAIYDWMAENIIYDYTYSIYHADECWERRTGVCNAFSELYVKLAQGCGLEAELIIGICRNSDNSDGTDGHAWNKVKTEKGWILLDVTWGSCYGHYHAWAEYGENSRIWFDVHPDWMIFTHFPDDMHDQLKPYPIARNVYLTFPNITPEPGAWGWDASRVLDYFKQHPNAQAPKFYVIPNYVWDSNLFLEYPCSMETGQEYTIRIRNINPDYPPRGDWEVEDDVYFCTATSGFSFSVIGCGWIIMSYPSPAKPASNDELQIISYPCE